MGGEAIYITGAGIISAIGNSVEQTKEALLNKESGIGTVQFLKSCHKELPCGEVKLSNSMLCKELGIDESHHYNRTSLLGIHAAREAIKEALLTNKELQKSYLIAGNTVGGMDDTEEHFLEMTDTGTHLELLKTHDSTSTTNLISSYFGIEPEHSLTISTACSSAANAIITGANMIKAGLCDIVIAGGSEALSKFHLNGFNSLMILDPQPCRPFDAERKGLNLGEGAAFVVLENRKSLIERGVTPIARVAGYGNRCDAYHQTASSANGQGALLAMQDALKMAKMEPLDIDYINAHGTGTPNNDESESHAIQRLFKEKVPPISSTKSFTGHTTSAAGAIESVISVIALTEGIIPANLGWEKQMEGGITPTMGIKGAMLHNVMCNSFGFGGNDSSLIFSKEEAGPAEQGIEEVKLKVLSSATLLPPEQPERLREFLSPMESRRLCGLLKGAMQSSLLALKKAGIESPDAIIMATTYGMLENSEKFLLQLCKEGEKNGGLSPTLFMQSTHNTIAGMVAIKCHCHGYNVTYTELSQQKGLEVAFRDAKMLLGQGAAKRILIGYHNEVTPLIHDMVLKLEGIDLPIGVTSMAYVVEKE